MAEITFLLYDIEGYQHTPAEVSEYALEREVTAPCDGLRLTFFSAQPLEEIDRIEMYRGQEKIFFGYVDAQRERAADGGNTVFLYARSSACLLIDNEAQPGTYTAPTAQAMYYLNAQDAGFQSRLPDCGVTGNYTVAKGTSRWGAIDTIVYCGTGRHMIVTPENVLTATAQGRFSFDGANIISERRCIHRGNALSRIDFKVEGQADYNRHYLCRGMEERGIHRSRSMNLAALPEWQRASVLQHTAQAAAADYRQWEITVSGAGGGQLYDKVRYHSARFGTAEGYLSAISIRCYHGGTTTVYTLTQPPELKEITYVD